MKTPTFLAALAALFLTLAASNARALTPAELTPQEQQRYATLKSDKTAADNFMITRDYIRKAKAVVEGKGSAMAFPDQPDEFDSKYLFPGESKVLQKAIQMAISAFIDSRSTTA
ncbi:MAG: hypothetical protein ACHQ51_01710 [Elusimicrobiota bacterium]